MPEALLLLALFSLDAAPDDPALLAVPEVTFALADLSPTACKTATPAVALASTGRQPGGGTILAQCTANCYGGGSVSCPGNPSVCSAYNFNCPNEQGHVVCDGVYYWCPTPCPECTNGSIMNVWTGGCCDDLREKDRYKCINEHWVYQYTFCGPPLCGPFSP